MFDASYCSCCHQASSAHVVSRAALPPQRSGFTNGNVPQLLPSSESPLSLDCSLLSYSEPFWCVKGTNNSNLKLKPSVRIFEAAAAVGSGSSCSASIAAFGNADLNRLQFVSYRNAQPPTQSPHILWSKAESPDHMSSSDPCLYLSNLATDIAEAHIRGAFALEGIELVSAQ